MPVNYYMYFVAALIPMVIGAAYYHPKAIGGPWMKTNGFTEKSLEEGNMGLIFGLSYIFSAMLALILGSLVIHQTSMVGLMIPEVFESGSAIQNDVSDFLTKYGDRHRTFSHGAFHGGILAVFLALPLIGINALFERRGWKYILIHLGYWFITLALMSGLLCATLEWAPLK